MVGLARYTKKYTYQGPTEFVIIILLLLFIGVMYVFLARANYGFAGFVLVSIASFAVIYWAIHLKRMARVEGEKPRYMPEQIQEAKSWVYDLIKGDNELVFVAEVPGPEEAVSVRLVNGILYIRGGQGFFKEVPLDVSEDMGIAEFRYRNGILTLKIKKL
ncbi:MAG: Hsp20/alpha crystallin family protein [Candidatus Nitrosothermus koennekii]|nr:MAG: Hsp20/alpha crystallin family protein [Candidatus Nitrosothermus koennekii]